MDENNLNNDLHESLGDSLEKHLSDEYTDELGAQEFDQRTHDTHRGEAPGGKLFSIFVPGVLVIFLLLGYVNDSGKKTVSYKTDGFVEAGLEDTASKINKNSMVSASELRKPVMDTVYTDKDVWFELRVDEQHVYQHWRDGHTRKFPVSSGNKFISKAVEARPGLFAIFYRNPHHKSSQFDDASLYHFQTFNQGIGFHALSGTGYYGNLGVRPSSHGCIRMSHKDAEQMFNDAEMGTLVLVHYGEKFARTVGFAPKGFKGKEFSKDEQKKLLAENLYNVLNGNYYVADREYFVVDPKVIPMSGIYVGYDKKLPKAQKMPARLYYYKLDADKLKMKTEYENLSDEVTAENEFRLVAASNNKKEGNDLSYSSDEELVKKYFNNPIGILPYFPPSPKRTSYVSTNSSSTSTSSSTNTTPSDNGSGE